MPMALPLATLAVGGASAYLQNRSANKATNANNKRQNDLYKTAMPYLQNGPSSVEDMIMELYKGGGNSSVSRDFSTSTDSIMQALRRGSNDGGFLQSQLRGLAETGDPYDMTNVLETLVPIRKRELDLSAGDLRAGAAGLGQRFGSAQRTAEVDLRRQAAEDAAAIDAEYLFKGHEGAAGRRLLATGQLGDLEGLDVTRQQTLLDSIFKGSQLGLQEKTVDNSLLQMLLGAQGNRSGNNANILSILGGLPGQQPTGYGNAGMDISQLLMMMQLFNNNPTAKTSTAPRVSYNGG